MMDQRLARAQHNGLSLAQSLTIMFLAVGVACGVDLGSVRQAQAVELVARHGSPGDLFYNYYAPPGYAYQSAEMYPSPRPTPPLVGHTYVTYQPLLPQEFLYVHNRTYVRHNPGAGWTTVNVSWNHDNLHRLYPKEKPLYTKYAGIPSIGCQPK